MIEPFGREKVVVAHKWYNFKNPIIVCVN